MSDSYNLKKIRDFLTEGFSIEELRDFTFLNFREVYEDFGETRKSELVRELLAYCQRKSLLDTLLEAGRQENPGGYERFAPFVQAASPKPQGPSSSILPSDPLIASGQPPTASSASPSSTATRDANWGKARSGTINTENAYGQSWAVVIGIDKYKHLPRLNYAVADANGVAEVLINYYGFPVENVLLHLNEDATYQKLNRLLTTTLPETTGPNDQVIIFFAGHGIKRPLPHGGERGYIAPIDAQPDVWHTFVSMHTLTGDNELLAAKHVFYILDSCYSGLATTRDAVLASRFQQDMLRKRARQVLTAGLDDQLVDDSGPGGHSIFTWHLIQGLSGGAAQNQEGIISATDLIHYVTNAVGNATSSRQTPDSGNFSGHESGGNFLFIPKEPASTSDIPSSPQSATNPPETPQRGATPEQPNVSQQTSEPVPPPHSDQNSPETQKMLDIKRRRLRELKYKEALQGINTPVEIIIEIEDLEKEIATLEAQLK